MEQYIMIPTMSHIITSSVWAKFVENDVPEDTVYITFVPILAWKDTNDELIPLVNITYTPDLLPINNEAVTKQYGEFHSFIHESRLQHEIDVAKRWEKDGTSKLSNRMVII